MRVARWLAIAGVALAAGCGRSDVVSCTIATPGDAGVTPTTCQEFAGLSPQDQDLWGRSCIVHQTSLDASVQEARFEHAACPHTGALGGCRLSGATAITNWYYAGGPYSAADIQTMCAQSGGAFVAP